MYLKRDHDHYLLLLLLLLAVYSLRVLFYIQKIMCRAAGACRQRLQRQGWHKTLTITRALGKLARARRRGIALLQTHAQISIDQYLVPNTPNIMSVLTKYTNI
ncbi:unnamed protein product [Ectocarpus sp. 12 AP-2014]